MRGLRLATGRDRPLRVLCLGAHCDDIEIGCGGTILTLARQDPGLVVEWVVLLFIAGSSVFPTGGMAGPTLTIVALALRLGTHLRQRYA